jgi:hypothetical protein
MSAQGVGVAALSATNEVLYIVVTIVEAGFNHEVYRRTHRKQIFHVLQHIF